MNKRRYAYLRGHLNLYKTKLHRLSMREHMFYMSIMNSSDVECSEYLLLTLTKKQRAWFEKIIRKLDYEYYT